MAISYKNIQHGNEVLLSASEYEVHLADYTVFEENFFKAFSQIVERYSSEPYVNGTRLYTVKYKGIDRPICILWGPLKNSGTSGVDSKRIQVLPAVTLREETPYFAIGAYNTLDTVIYTVVLGGVREFIKHAQNGKSYSSLWIDYPSLWDAYKYGFQDWTDSKGRDVLACKADKIEKIHEAIKKLVALINNNRTNDKSNCSSDDPMQFVDFDKELGKYETDESLPRNTLFRDIALKRENYTCELCGTNKTFTDKNNEEYFEGHHLIMYNLKVQSRYKYCLDHPNNIICLCPTCHRHIHHASATDTQNMLIKLFTKHNDLLKSYGIKNLKEIISDYTK